MVTRQPLHSTLFAHVTQHRWHFWCTEMAPSGKESAHATFANFTMSEGPDDTVTSAPPAFPEDKKKEYLSRNDLKQVEKNERMSAGQQKCRPHNFVPLCDGTKTVCDVLNFYLFSNLLVGILQQMLARRYAVRPHTINTPCFNRCGFTSRV